MCFQLALRGPEIIHCACSCPSSLHTLGADSHHRCPLQHHTHIASDKRAHTTREQPLTVSPGRNTATMAAPQSNGRAKKVSKPKANGYLNASPNVGSINGHLNGHADKSQSSSVAMRPRKQRRTFSGAVTSIVLRYVVFCVSSLDTAVVLTSIGCRYGTSSSPPPSGVLPL